MIVLINIKINAKLIIMVNLAKETKYKGGLCYAACQELFSFYNPSVLHCRKGCDFGEGRVNDPKLRL